LNEAACQILKDSSQDCMTLISFLFSSFYTNLNGRQALDLIISHSIITDY